MKYDLETQRCAGAAPALEITEDYLEPLQIQSSSAVPADAYETFLANTSNSIQPSLGTRATIIDAYEALYAMKGSRCVQWQDDSTLGILMEILLLYQLGLIVKRYQMWSDRGRAFYPSFEVVSAIIDDLTNEGVFTDTQSFRSFSSLSWRAAW